ncbi:hypothetical protein GGX14DRAFT_408416 [Mycena pura]|uniref:Uncharacterized protein n=1 Tax=Mycena pura TaxID=153505 RepID=A0AAD6ULM6_9AGAR|nr:hypothetical protein GGX14DRAFT_408416 [Mycena pura]
MPRRQNNLDPQLVARCFPVECSPSHKVNTPGFAMLRKMVELVTCPVLLAELGSLVNLSMCMGTRKTASQYGRIIRSYIWRPLTNFQGVQTNFTAIPSEDVQKRIRRYHKAICACYKKTGDDFIIVNIGALQVLQNEEQRWHNWIVREFHGRRRPNWALEPLPGLDRVYGSPVWNSPPPPVPAPPVVIDLTTADETPRGLKRKRVHATVDLTVKRKRVLPPIDLTRD